MSLGDVSTQLSGLAISDMYHLLTRCHIQEGWRLSVEFLFSIERSIFVYLSRALIGVSVFNYDAVNCSVLFTLHFVLLTCRNVT